MLKKMRFLPPPSHKNYQFSVLGQAGRPVQVTAEAEFVCNTADKNNARVLKHVAGRVPGLPGADGVRACCLVELGEVAAPNPVRRAPPPKPAEGGGAALAASDAQRDPNEPPKPYENKPAHVAFAKSLGLEVEGMKKDAIIAAYTAELARRRGEVEEAEPVEAEAASAPERPTDAGEQPEPSAEAPAEG